MRSWWRLLWQGISLILNHNIGTDIPKCDKVLIAGFPFKIHLSCEFDSIYLSIHSIISIIIEIGKRRTIISTWRTTKANVFKFLPSQSCPKIALAFNEQLFESIPYDDHDFRIDIVFRKSVYSCRSNSRTFNNGLMYLHVYSVGRHGHVDLCKAISSIELTKFYINQTHNSIVVFAIFKIKNFE